MTDIFQSEAVSSDFAGKTSRSAWLFPMRVWLTMGMKDSRAIPYRDSNGVLAISDDKKFQSWEIGQRELIPSEKSLICHGKPKMAHSEEKPYALFVLDKNSPWMKKHIPSEHYGRFFKEQDAFFKEVKDAQHPSDEPISFKSSTRSFNHTHDFAIEGKTLWCRLRNPEKISINAWQPIFFDGYPRTKPVSLDVDGANLVVLDNENKIHYKKVLQEIRASEIESDRPQVQEEYLAVDLSRYANWFDSWFSLPVISNVVNVFTGKRLKIPSDAKAWAISHRGTYNDHVEDADNKIHKVSTGVTTLYILNNDGKEIQKHDPWSPIMAKMNLTVPETANTTFEAENLTVGSSTVMLVGYEVKKENEGTVKTLTLEGKAAITKHITVIQTGEGNNAREIRVEGLNAEGKSGYYYKKVDEQNWHFEKTMQVIDTNYLPKILNSNEPFQTTVYNYQSAKVSWNVLKDSNVSFKVEDFGNRSFESPVQITIDGVDIPAVIYRKKTFKNFLGLEGDSFDLVIRAKFPIEPPNEKVEKAFQQKVIPLNVVEGAYTCVSALQLSEQYNIQLPITETVNKIVYENMKPIDAVQALMQRTIKEEHL
jgi:hypothetical protein